MSLPFLHPGLVFAIFCLSLHSLSSECLSCGVMVTQQILVLSFWVRIPAAQHEKAVMRPPFSLNRSSCRQSSRTLPRERRAFSGERRGGIPGSLFPGGFSGFPAHAAGGGRCGRFGPVRAGNGALGVFFLHLGGGVRRALRRFVQFPGEERQRLCGFIGRGAGLPVVFLFFHTNVRLADLAV